MSARIAWGMCAAAFALVAIGLAFLVSSGGTPPGSTLGSPTLDGAINVITLVFPVVGVLIATRQPSNTLGWMFLGTGLALSLEQVLIGYAMRTLVEAPGSLPGGALAAVIADLVWVPIVLGGIGGLCLLFPDGRLPSRRWRPAVWLGAALAAGYVAGTMLKPGPLYYFPAIDNPLGFDRGGSATGSIAEVSSAAAIGLMLVSVSSLVLRFRRSRGQERQQFKWLAYVAGLLALLTPVLVALGDVDIAGVPLSDVVFVSLICFMPVAVGIAILRHRLYDVDLVINRTLVYGALTLTLGAAYLGSVLLIGLAVGDSGVAVAASTLAVAALFGPARARIQGLVDRRFYRRRYDASQTLEAFSARLRDELELDAVGGDLRAVVRETVQPAHVSLWLRGPS